GVVPVGEQPQVRGPLLVGDLGELVGVVERVVLAVGVGEAEHLGAIRVVVRDVDDRRTLGDVTEPVGVVEGVGDLGLPGHGESPRVLWRLQTLERMEPWHRTSTLPASGTRLRYAT